MDHADHVRLIRDGVAGLASGTWADLGSGTGAFTLALADLLGSDGSIVSVDRDAEALVTQARLMAMRFPGVRVRYVRADVTDELAIEPVDGVVMANALHFIRDRDVFLTRLVSWIRPGGRLVLVEYDSDRGNTWVPHPLSWDTWRDAAERVGMRDTRLIGRVPSRFLGSIYAAVSVVREKAAVGTIMRP
ncbi:MAG: class I SAM-dependent methyltransferase [Chloroflexi bacterium]|nr:class I SAM-dependent methyltransferase [Chloroflexota bacterium]